MEKGLTSFSTLNIKAFTSAPASDVPPARSISCRPTSYSITERKYLRRTLAYFASRMSSDGRYSRTPSSTLSRDRRPVFSWMARRKARTLRK